MDERNASDAAQDLFEQHGDEIYRYVLYTVSDETDTEDIVQDIFLRVLKSWERFHHQSSPKTWLWSIANNCIREYLRKQQKRKARHVPLDRDFVDESQSDLDGLMALQLEENLQLLTPPQRQVFVERVIHKRDTSETAETLGWTEGKVRTTLHRAMKRVREVMGKGDEADA